MAFKFLKIVLYLYKKISIFSLLSLTRIILDCSYLLIFYFEKIPNLSLPFAVNRKRLLHFVCNLVPTDLPILRALGQG